jgi:hypothetical protein
MGQRVGQGEGQRVGREMEQRIGHRLWQGVGPRARWGGQRVCVCGIGNGTEEGREWDRGRGRRWTKDEQDVRQRMFWRGGAESGT